MSHSHNHAAHDHHGPTPERALWIALILNGAFLILEAIIGWWTQSLALLADAGHMVSDVFSLAVALVAVRTARRAASADYTFGLRRTPVLGALFNAITLIAIVIFIVIEAIPRFATPPSLAGGPILWTGVAGLAINLASAWYLARSQDQSVNTRGAMLHLLADALGSVAALISGAAMMWGVPLADPIASVVIAGLVLLGTLPLLRDTVRILLQRAPAGIDVGELRGMILAHAGVVAIDELHVWEIDAGEPILSAVLCVDTATTLLEANAVGDTLRAELRAVFHIKHATFELRSVPLPDDAPRC